MQKDQKLRHHWTLLSPKPAWEASGTGQLVMFVKAQGTAPALVCHSEATRDSCWNCEARGAEGMRAENWLEHKLLSHSEDRS